MISFPPPNPAPGPNPGRDRDIQPDTGFIPTPRLPLPAPPDRLERWARESVLARIVGYGVVFCVLMILILFECALAAYVVGMDLPPYRPGLSVDPYTVRDEFTQAVAAVLAFVLMTLVIDRRPWRATGLALAGLPRQLGLGLLLGLAMCSVMVAVCTAFHWYRVTAVTPAWSLLGWPLAYNLAIGVFEETVCRGYLLQTIERRWGSGLALLATCVLFGLAHFGNHETVDSSLGVRLAWPVFVMFTLGLTLGAAYLLTRSLWFCIGLHAAWDYAISRIYGFDSPAAPVSLLRADLSAPVFHWLGLTGDEVNWIVACVSLPVSAVLLALALRRGRWVPWPRRGVTFSAREVSHAA